VNQYRVSAAGLESIFGARMPKILLQQYRPTAEVGEQLIYPFDPRPGYSRANAQFRKALCWL
jgi:hypothetical protein